MTVPAPVRRRWDTERVALEDHGDYLLLRPLADPIDGFVGFAAGRGAQVSEEMRAQSRREDAVRAGDCAVTTVNLAELYDQLVRRVGLSAAEVDAHVRPSWANRSPYATWTASGGRARA